MKRTRKGFTLVELLIVIAVIGILSTMAVIGDSEANNIATANKIVEEFKIISAAMNMYYADNRTTCDAADATSLAATIKTGLAPYLKMDVSDTNSPITAETTGDVGKYNIMVTDAKQWWLSYTLPEADSKVASILANKAATEGFKKATTDSSSNTTTYNEAYEASETTIYMRVR